MNYSSKGFFSWKIVLQTLYMQYLSQVSISNNDVVIKIVSCKQENAEENDAILMKYS